MRRLRSTRGLLALVAIVPMAILLAPQAASAAPKWSLQTTPNPTPETKTALSGVSCASSSSCTAVGYDKYRGESFGEYWNGTAWKVAEVPAEGVMTSVSCAPASTVYCMAVGTNSGGSLHYWETKEGRTVFEPEGAMAVPGGGTGLKIRSVSCSSESACTAVGAYTTEAKESKPLVERWSGKEWAVESAPNPSSGTASEAMLSVSCAAASACTAVGAASGKPTAERWNGTEWSLATPPNPTGATEAKLEAVSCASSTSCMAVGSLTESATSKKTLSEIWSSGEWKVQSSPNPVGAAGNVILEGVSCASAGSCHAVGTYVSKYNTTLKLVEEEETLAESWNGTEWTVQSSPNTSGDKFNGLAGVSCSSSTACAAVGISAAKSLTGETSALGESWNGTAWSLQSVPVPTVPTVSVLKGVSCASSSSCTAVGYDNYHGDSFGEYWNGTAWKIAEVPAEGVMTSVSCAPASTVYCMAVGTNSGGSLHYWETKEGRTVFEPEGAMAVPGGGTGLKIRSVSCSSESECTAVGAYTTEAKRYKPLVERWSGGKWSIQSTGEGAGLDQMLSVSCPSSTFCASAGSENGEAPAAARWSESEWLLETLPQLSGVVEVVLEAVACGSSTSCVAVGYYRETGHPKRPYAEELNGKEWLPSYATDPEGAEGNAILYAVSCVPGTSSCYSAGSFVSKYEPILGADEEEKTLVESWDAPERAWGVQSSPNPAGTKYNWLTGVSCSSSTVCTAVGTTRPKSGESTTLAEHYE